MNIFNKKGLSIEVAVSHGQPTSDALDINRQLNDESIHVFKASIESAPLGVYNNTTREYSIIPASIHPMILSDKLWDSLQLDASLILSALEKVGRWLRRREQNDLSRVLFSNLSPIEKDVAFDQLNESPGLVTARLDLFFDGEDLSVIEVNTTIPAMQAYSDIIKNAYWRAWSPRSHESPQSNTQDLLLSLLQHYERSGGRKHNPRIAIVARSGDSQLAELLWFQAEWQKSGFETLLVAPEEIELKGAQLWTGSTPIDLTYRHIFAHRLKLGSAFAEACLQSEVYRVFNPISAHLEAKGVLAELSRLAADNTLSTVAGLSDSEREATVRRVAWSRLLKYGPSIGPDGEYIPDFVSWLKNHKASLVVKSSLGYGGKGVVIGANFEDRLTQQRLMDLLSVSQEISWDEFIDLCINKQGGQWIAQRKLEGRQVNNRFLLNGKLIEKNSFVDCSIFASSGVAHKPSGGACRFSSDAIVNIGQGGGLAPLFIEREYKQLMELKNG